jgi:hypothetical protein
MSGNLLLIVGSAMALFLAGANTAFIVDLGRELTTWFIFKIVSIDLLMIYVALSLAVGHPDIWRAAIAVIALFLDLLALGWMWLSIVRLQSAGVEGLIPLARLDHED